jgi:hypothetical protein
VSFQCREATNLVTRPLLNLAISNSIYGDGDARPYDMLVVGMAGLPTLRSYNDICAMTDEEVAAYLQHANITPPGAAQQRLQVANHMGVNLPFITTERKARNSLRGNGSAVVTYDIVPVNDVLYPMGLTPLNTMQDNQSLQGNDLMGYANGYGISRGNLADVEVQQLIAKAVGVASDVIHMDTINRRFDEIRSDFNQQRQDFNQLRGDFNQ